MGISIFPSQGGGYTLQRVITTTGTYSLGAPTPCFVMMAGGGGGGGGGAGSTNSSAGGGGGGGGAFAINTMLSEFHATIGAGGSGSAANTNGASSGGTTALTIGGGSEQIGNDTSSPTQMYSKQIVCRGGSAGNGVGTGTAGNQPATVTGITGRDSSWIYGSPGSSGAGYAGQTYPTFTGAWRTAANQGGTYLAHNMFHNNSGMTTQQGGTPSQLTFASFNSFLLFPGGFNPSNNFNPNNSTYSAQWSHMTQVTDAGRGVACGGEGAWNSNSTAGCKGAAGIMTGGGGGGGYSNTLAANSGGATLLYRAGLGSTSGGGGGGGAGIFGAGTDGTFTSSAAGGNGGAGGLGGGGGGGGGGGTSSSGTGGAGGAGLMLIFF